MGVERKMKFNNFKLKGASVATIIKIVAIVVLLLVGLSMFFIVDETECAVITRFGAYNRTVGSGLQWKLPLGIESSTKVPIKVVQTEQFGFKTVKAGRNNDYRNNITSESTMLTGDLNIVDVEWIIQYRIEDAFAWLFGVQEKKQTIRDIARSSINILVGDRAILSVMGQERESIESNAQKSMNESFTNLGLGIKVIAVKLQNIVPPEGVQDAFEDVNKATQDMNRYINEGKEAYNSEIPKAQGEAQRLIASSKGYATERVNKAQGDVARFNAIYEEYKKSPAVTKSRLYMETMAQVFSKDGSNKNTQSGDDGATGGGSNSEGATIIDGKLNNVLPIKNLVK